MSTPAHTLCLCGCGQPLQLKGRPARFRPGHNMKTPEGRAAMAARSRRLRACARLGISPGAGRKIDREGYVLIKAPGHPQADCQGYLREHRLAMEAQIGRLLAPGEVVHHRNGDKADNRIQNLWLFPSNGAHHAWHRMLRGSELRALMPAVPLAL